MFAQSWATLVVSDSMMVHLTVNGNAITTHEVDLTRNSITIDAGKIPIGSNQKLDLYIRNDGDSALTFWRIGWGEPCWSPIIEGSKGPYAHGAIAHICYTNGCNVAGMMKKPVTITSNYGILLFYIKSEIIE